MATHSESRNHAILQYFEIDHIHQLGQSGQCRGMPIVIQYADGSGVSGTFGTDRLSISGTPINITAQFLWATKDTVIFPAGVVGLVGMGYTTTPNFLDIAYQNG